MAIDKNTLKNWFQKGTKPLENHFTTWLDSYWHKSEQIPTSSIQDLENTLNQKAETVETQTIRQALDDARQQIDDIANGITPVSNAQYAANLGTLGNSYTKANLDITIDKKVDKIPGRELMPSPGADPKADYFLNEQGEYVQGYTQNQIDEKLSETSCNVQEIVCRTDEEIQIALNEAEASQTKSYILILDFLPNSQVTLTGNYTASITIRNITSGMFANCNLFKTTGWLTITSQSFELAQIHNLNTEKVKIINSDITLSSYKKMTELHIIGSYVRLIGSPRTSAVQKISVVKSTTNGYFYGLTEVIAFQGSNARGCNNPLILEKIRFDSSSYNNSSDYVSAYPDNYVSHAETPMIYTDECWEREDFARISRIQVVNEYPTDLTTLKDGDIIIKL